MSARKETLNPSNCECEYNKSYNVDKYLDNSDCKYKKKIKKNKKNSWSTAY